MIKRSLKECEPGDVVFTTESIGDDRNSMEIRDTFYIRDPDDVCRHPHNVCCGLIGMVQGNPFSKDGPRVMKISKPTRDPGEADGRTQVESIIHSVWAKHPVVAMVLFKALGIGPTVTTTIVVE